ncbi:hypothetical protein GCM10027275_17150 [Rhabdobacter roseus]|uniref:Kinase n=1 Tax=Rhabdobacter roseus TaxID=1655419 RepID=A0A840TVE5_9BACT|nr:AAA family ATPase [Rhabdobacter roseus]MBB5283639.1 hypothetical protein [Rhabdobacter roseus]
MQRTGRLFLVMGLPASGKTSFARALAAALDGVHLSSDAIRAELARRGTYQDADKEAVYAEMLRRTAQVLSEGRDVVADATFHRQARRALFLNLAKAQEVPYRLIEIRASEATTRQRLQVPRPDSEATWAVYLLLKKEWEPPTEPHEVLYTDHATPEELVEGYLGEVL